MFNHPVKKFLDARLVGGRKVQPQLKAPPDSFVEQFAVIGCANGYDVARQLIELHKEKRDNPLYFAGFMRITALFADCVELVEEKDARSGPDIVEKLTKARVGLTQITSDQRVITHNKKWKAKRLGDRLSEGCLAVARRPGEQHAVAWLISMRAQYVSPYMLLNQLPPVLLDGERQKQLFHTGAWLDFQDGILAGPRLE